MSGKEEYKSAWKLPVYNGSLLVVSANLKRYNFLKAKGKIFISNDFADEIVESKNPQVMLDKKLDRSL